MVPLSVASYILDQLGLDKVMEFVYILVDTDMTDGQMIEALLSVPTSYYISTCGTIMTTRLYNAFFRDRPTRTLLNNYTTGPTIADSPNILKLLSDDTNLYGYIVCRLHGIQSCRDDSHLL